MPARPSSPTPTRAHHPRTALTCCALCSLCALCIISLTSACASGGVDEADLARRLRGIYDPGLSDRFPSDDLIINPFDLNNDGTADMWKVFTPTQQFVDGKASIRLVRKEMDTNFDGRVDLWLLYNDQESLKEQHADTHFQGVVTQRDLFEKGQLIRREHYPNGFTPGDDTHPTSRKYYKSGKLFKVELDPNADGLINRWEIFIQGRLAQIGYDHDGDGRADFWQEVSSGTP
jgi:hypothetical protein